MADVLPSGEVAEEPSDFGALRPGTRLGRYEMLVPIARGGMARVWAARLHGQRAFQKLVAIKVILPHLAEEAEFERMFLDEARIASGVHHPNVCEIYELGEEQKTLYLAMEWVNGDSFARVLRSGGGTTEAIDPRVVARVMADACGGIHAAHELTDDDGRPLGVVHRDLSPHNILISADGIAKVCDFGVAKALDQLHEATSAGQLKGKLAYMAPEQILGGAVDRRSDVFSLGCVLYEATTGLRPFRGDGDHQVMHAVLKGELAPPTSLLRGYPQELERIVMRALAPQPILRFPTAERLRFALEEYIAHGQLVTQSNVAQVVRARIGDQIDRRKERIRQASTAGDREGGWSESPGNMTPSNEAQGGHRSGVKASNALAGAGEQGARPHFATMQMERPQAAAALAQLTAGDAVPPTVAPATRPMVAPHAVPPGGSTTISQPPPFAPGHTPVSYPGASQPGASMPGPAHSGHPQQGLAGHVPSTSLPFDDTAAVTSPIVNMPPAFTSPAMPGRFPPRHNALAPAKPPVPPFDAARATSDGPQSTPPAGASHYAIAIAIGIFLAVLIGVGGLFFWRGHHAAPTIGGAAPTATAPIASGASGDRSDSVAPASADITFRLMPAEATLSLEGQDLPGDLRTVPRPEIGKSVNVVVRAKGYEDVTVLVDFFTTSPMDLSLKPLGTGTQAADPPRAAAPKAKDPPKDAPPKGPRPPKDPGVPANPY